MAKGGRDLESWNYIDKEEVNSRMISGVFATSNKLTLYRPGKVLNNSHRVRIGPHRHVIKGSTFFCLPLTKVKGTPRLKRKDARRHLSHHTRKREGHQTH
jgi:hypothetical protein